MATSHDSIRTDDTGFPVTSQLRDDLPISPLVSEFDDDGGNLLETQHDVYSDPNRRLFIALFDYDPETMSPNQDGAHEELPFREGQIIQVSFQHFSFLLMQLCTRTCVVKI